MLSKIEDLGSGIRRVAVPDVWRDVEEAVSDVIGSFYDDPLPDGLYPHFNEVALRGAMLSRVPALDELRREIEEFVTAGGCALVVDRLHVGSFPVPRRNRLLFALGLALGFPTPSNQRRPTLLWDVKPRQVPEDRRPTYSEHSGEADLHTDSQSYPSPEEYFMLYVVRAARCGGGASLFCSAEEIRGVLSATAAGRDALNVLSQPRFPFLISTGAARPGVTVAPILSTRPGIRFRRDVLEEGFRARRDLAAPEAEDAVAALLDALEHRVRVVEAFMADDAIAICNNHAMLHGRRRFEDRERHLIRVRMGARPLMVQMAALARQGAESFGRAVLGG